MPFDNDFLACGFGDGLEPLSRLLEETGFPYHWQVCPCLPCQLSLRAFPAGVCQHPLHAVPLRAGFLV